MIQILGLRSWTPKGEDKPKTFDAFHDKEWRAKSVNELFVNLQTYLELIPDNEKWNIFYTINNCTEMKRDFKSCSTLGFDIDGGKDKTDGHDKGAIELDKWKQYAEVLGSVLGCDAEKLAVVNSGNGLHFLFNTEGPPIKDREFFKKNRHHYAAVCKLINVAIKKAGLGGEADPSIFEHRRILRMPGTINRKPNQPDKLSALLQEKITRIGFNLPELSGLPDIEKGAQIPKDIMGKYPDVDTEAIKAGCNFLAWCGKSPNEVSEPLWYAALSIAGRMTNGREYAHKLSEGHKYYDKDETDVKLDQAVESSGPRTCENIRDLGFGGCDGCKHYDAVVSPISIVSEGHIKTANTGFHTYIPPGKLIPNYGDLLKQFNSDFCFKGYESSREVYVYKDTHYEKCGWNMIEEYAQTKFKPMAKTTMTKEFLNLVIRTNLRHKDFWIDEPAKKTNFKNGILDIHTGEFSEHSPDAGFRYVLPYDYDAAAKAPVFQAMLEKVTCGDKDLQKVLLEFMGYCLSNDSCWTQKALVLVGSGANGKSTFLDCLMNLAGAGNYSAATMKDLQKSEYSRQLLDGKLFNIAEETPTGAMLDSSLFKTVVAGGELQVRAIYKDPYFFKNTAKFVFSCNELPDAGDTSHGFYRRFEMVPFNAVFSKDDEDYDPHIDKKLKTELPGIFNLAIWGYKRLVENQRFTDSSKVSEAIEIYKQETDSVLSWFDDNTHVNGDKEKFAALSDLYIHYKIQTEGQGRVPVTRPKFTRNLRKYIKDFSDRYTVRKMPDTKACKRGLVGVSYGEGVGLKLVPTTNEEVLSNDY